MNVAPPHSRDRKGPREGRRRGRRRADHVHLSDVLGVREAASVFAGRTHRDPRFGGLPLQRLGDGLWSEGLIATQICLHGCAEIERDFRPNQIVAVIVAIATK